MLFDVLYLLFFFVLSLWGKKNCHVTTLTNCPLSSNYSASDIWKVRNQITLYVRTVSEVGVMRS